MKIDNFKLNTQGLLLCARYSVAPNYFGYCGPDKNKSLIDHLKENVADSEVTHILKEFETLYPYLQLIAYSNKIKDPFNERVVEAYWLGNSLLKNVSPIYPSFLKEKLLLDKRINKTRMSGILKKVFSMPVLPHHSFHVFNIFKRTGNVAADHSLKTMDECRINFGRIIESSITQNHNLKVRTNLLVAENNKLLLGKEVIKKLTTDYKGKSFIKDLKPGDWVSFHWGMICDKLTQVQVKNLEFYTQKAIDFYNS